MCEVHETMTTTWQVCSLLRWLKKAVSVCQILSYRGSRVTMTHRPKEKQTFQPMTEISKENTGSVFVERPVFGHVSLISDDHGHFMIKYSQCVTCSMF